MMRCNSLFLGAILACFSSASAQAEDCAVKLHVLGVAQDAGKPQIGNSDDPAWKTPSLRRLAVSMALTDERGETPKRWLFDASPHLTEQLYRLDGVVRTPHKIGLDGIFLTHAHIGHYTGLMFLGHEAAGAREVPVYAMERMAAFLTNNGPWSQLVRYRNIDLRPLTAYEPVTLERGITVTPLPVPHRQEFSEVVGYRIKGPTKSALYLPDIDRWSDWDAMGVKLEELLAALDYAFVDATFFSGDELPGRDMSKIPHPTVRTTMDRLADLSASERAKVHFIHMNHTNPLHDAKSAARSEVRRRGYHVAEEGQQICL